jgi:hypothetical protein
MKKNILIIAFILGFGLANAQNIQNVNVSFIQTLFPKKTLPANVKNYNVRVTTPYLKDDSSFRKIAEDQYQTDLKNFPNTIAEAKKRFAEVEMVNYNVKLEEAKERYKLESDQFNKMSTLERLALIDKKPTLQYPPKPVYYDPPVPRLESINVGDIIIYNPETLAKSYIKLNGFGDGTDGIQIKIDFKGFEYVEPVATLVNVENYNPQTKEKFYTKQTQFVTKYRHPTMLQVSVDGKNLSSGIFQGTSEFQIKNTSSKPTRLYIERQEIETIISNINNYLNDQYGYITVNRYAVLYSVKNKKGEYDDVEKARDFAISGYKNYTQHQEDAVKDIANAIAIWEKTITEVNYDDNKARIDEKVGTAILKNLIFATIMTNEFVKANKYLTDFKSLRLSYDDKQFADSYEKIAADLKSRFEGK